MAGTTFAVADLHGRFDLLEAALDAIEGYGAPLERDRTVIFLGDYVDRGPESARILDRLSAAPPADWRWTCLKGNHEAMMALALRNPERFDWWLENGGGATVASYGERRERIADHLAWIDRLPSIHTDAHRVYVHAGVEPRMPLHAQAEMTLLWKRYPKGAPGGHGARHVVHGHDPDEDGPLLYERRTALDTRAWSTGRLVIGVFDDQVAGAPVDMIEVIRAPA
jgi:serine/threonine protein phosphatase 1